MNALAVGTFLVCIAFMPPSLRPALVFLLLTLAACAGPRTPTASVCTVKKVAEIPATVERGFITVPALINGKPATMEVDTGAEVLMVTPSAVANLGLSADRHQGIAIRGTGGVIKTHTAALQSLKLGGLTMLDRSAAVGSLPGLTAQFHPSGLIGADLLNNFTVEFDLPHQRIALYNMQGCAADFVPSSGVWTSTRIGLFGRGLPLLPLTLDGHQITAILDSGANASVFDQNAAGKVGVIAADLVGDRAGRSIGVDGTMRESHLHHFNDLVVGGLRFTDPPIRISPMQLPVGDMLLAADWLRQIHVWINYPGRRLIIGLSARRS